MVVTITPTPVQQVKYVMTKVGAWIERVALGGVVVGSAAVVLTMLLIVADVLGRKFFKSVPGALELSEGLMIVIIFMPAAYVALRKGHIFIDAVTMHLPRNVQIILDAFSAVFGLVLFGIIAWMSWGVAWQAFQIGEYRVGLVSIPIWPFRMVFSIGYWLLCIALIYYAIREAARVTHA